MLMWWKKYEQAVQLPSSPPSDFPKGKEKEYLRAWKLCGVGDGIGMRLPDLGFHREEIHVLRALKPDL